MELFCWQIEPYSSVLSTGMRGGRSRDCDKEGLALEGKGSQDHGSLESELEVGELFALLSCVFDLLLTINCPSLSLDARLCRGTWMWRFASCFQRRDGSSAAYGRNIELNYDLSLFYTLPVQIAGHVRRHPSSRGSCRSATGRSHVTHAHLRPKQNPVLLVDGQFVLQALTGLYYTRT
jgi:hypothetical protein